jgi:hypothetical protein
LARGGYSGIPDSIEIEVAERFFDGAVFGLLQTFGKFSGENVFLGFFCFHGGPELRLDSFGLLAQEARRVVEINGRRRPGRWDVREHHSEITIKSELCVTARAIGFEGFFTFARHAAILRQFAASGMITCSSAAKRNLKKNGASKNTERRRKSLQNPND